MIIKSFEHNKINKEFNNYFLLYGENDGAKSDFINIILNEKVKKIVRYHENEIISNKDDFYSSITSKSFFENEKIIMIQNSTNKIYEIIFEIIEKNLDNLTIILEAGTLEKKSKLRNYFEKNKQLVCVPFYPDTQQTLNIIANNYFKKRKIVLSQQSINMIVDRSNGNRQHLKNELDKIDNLYLSNKNIKIEDIIKITNLGNQNSASELTNFCLAKNKQKMKKILNENNFSDEDSILIIKTLLIKTKRLLNLSNANSKNQNIDSLISSHKPPIFWKEKDLVKEHLKKWNLINIKKLISEISEIELLIKKIPNQSKIILNDFLMRTSEKINN